MRRKIEREREKSEIERETDEILKMIVPNSMTFAIR